MAGPIKVSPIGSRSATRPAGTVISGNLYVDTFLAAVPPYDETTGDETAAFPYTYTIG